MKYKIKTLKIVTCNCCPCLGIRNVCDETEDFIHEDIAECGPIPDNCPLEEKEYDE